MSVCSKLEMEENHVYDVAEGVDYIANDSPSYDTTSFITKPIVRVPGYEVLCHDMAEVTAPSANLKAKKPARGCPCSWVCNGLVLVGVVACVSMVVSVWSIAMVYNISNGCEAQKNSHAVFEQASSVDALNITLNTAIDSIRSELTELMNRVNQNSKAFDFLRNEFTLRIDEVNETLRGHIPSFPDISCSRISQRLPSTPSAFYWVTASNGSAVRVYCDMTRSCGGVTGGWMRVARLNFSDTSTSCPCGLRERVDSGIHTCGIESPGAACPSVMFSTSGVEYTKVCGKILAYQFSSPDAFGDDGRGPNPDIDSNYVDGVSLTHGHTPRNHIWTFAAALDEGDDDESTCECSHSQSAGKSSPSFVGQDYFCDSGSQNYDIIFDTGDFFPNDPLWDGDGCGSESTCCSFNNPPWFHKELPSSTSDDIEMRVCIDEGRFNEDIALSSVEIYVQ